MVVAAARLPSRARARASSVPGHGRVGQGGHWQTVIPGPGQRHGRRAGISAGPGRVEGVPVESCTQYRCWRPAPAGRDEGWGDGRQRVGDAGPGAGCCQGPFHRSVGRRVLQPADGGRRACAPGRRLPRPRAEVQAFAGSADELSTVTVRQPSGDERPRPGPAGMPADLERAAAVRPAADRMDPDIKRVHASQPPRPRRYASAHMTGSSGPRLARRAGPRVRWPSGRSTRLPGGLRRSTRTSRDRQLSASGMQAPAATEGERDGMRQSNTFGAECRFRAAGICAGCAGMAAQISQIGTPPSAGQVVEGGERAVDDLGAWQRAG